MRKLCSGLEFPEGPVAMPAGTGCVTAITLQGKVKAVLPVPVHDPIVPRVCLGEDDMGTAFITSSARASSIPRKGIVPVCGSTLARKRAEVAAFLSA